MSQKGWALLSRIAECDGTMMPPTSTTAISAPGHPKVFAGKREILVQCAWALADAAMMVFASFAAAWVRYDLDLNTVFVRHRQLHLPLTKW